MKLSQTLLFFLAAFFNTVIAYSKPVTLHQLDERVKAGDEQALFAIASYFDSSGEALEYSGSGDVFYDFTESQIAKKIVRANCLFTTDEINITDYTTATEFQNFLLKNKTKILFSKPINAFLITPLVNRSVRFEMRIFSKKKKTELQSDKDDLLKTDYPKGREINTLIKQKDPLVLLEIASEYFRTRPTIDEDDFTRSKFIALIQLLTGVEIGVENETKEMSWHYEDNYESDASLNLLILFSKIYKQYSWDSTKSTFSNPLIQARPLFVEETLFDNLMDKNDSIALNAFVELSTGDANRVATLSDDYLHHGDDLKVNYELPTFTFSFLKQMSLLTSYCNSNGIDYNGSKELRKSINSLRGDLSFKERFRLENDMIDRLSLDEVTALEYWALVYEKSWGLTYSVGHILDKFYSKNWQNILQNKRQLACYLKKAALFNQLGIIGSCNSYLLKFKKSPDSVLAMLKAYQTSDKDIQNQIDKILSQNNNTSSASNAPFVQWKGDSTYVVDNLQQQFDELIAHKPSTMERDYAIDELFSKISYAQIKIATDNIEKFHFYDDENKELMPYAKDGLSVTTNQNSGKKYSFLETDFGLNLCGDFGNDLVRGTFLQRYSSFSEYDLYSIYLDEVGVAYKNLDGKLDYDKMYDLLKYDVVEAFVGGGGGANQDGEVYSLIKMLEITFNTTLGFPPKRCNSAGMRYCDCAERVNAWMRYIEEHKLLQYTHTEPGSFREE